MELGGGASYLKEHGALGANLLLPVIKQVDHHYDLVAGNFAMMTAMHMTITDSRN
jgi:hypothetical protein